MSSLVEALEALTRAFARLGLRWYVFGAQAAILHGATRATADIDVTVDAGGHTTGELAGALRAEGFTLRVEDDEDFVARTRVLPATHRSGVPVDIVLAGPGLEDVFFERVVERKIGGARVPVASAEDVIVMKVLAGRSKDLDDVRGYPLREAPRARCRGRSRDTPAPRTRVRSGRPLAGIRTTVGGEGPIRLTRPAAVPEPTRPRPSGRAPIGRCTRDRGRLP